MVSTLFRDPQALSSALASLQTQQPWTFRSLNRVETLDSASNHCVHVGMHVISGWLYLILFLLAFAN